MDQPVTLTFIFQTIGVILAVTAIGIVLVNKKTKRRNEFPGKSLKKEK